MKETISPEQAHEIVQELRNADFKKVGLEYFDSRVDRLKAAGWVLGVIAYPEKKVKNRRGQVLRTVRNVWRNVAYFYSVLHQTKVWYWNNSALGKQDAMRTASHTPAPAAGESYTMFNKPTTGYVKAADLTTADLRPSVVLSKPSEPIFHSPSRLQAAFDIIESMRLKGYVVQIDNGLDGTWEVQFYIPTPRAAGIPPDDSEMNYGAGHTLLEAVKSSYNVAMRVAILQAK